MLGSTFSLSLGFGAAGLVYGSARWAEALGPAVWDAALGMMSKSSVDLETVVSIDEYFGRESKLGKGTCRIQASQATYVIRESR